MPAISRYPVPSVAELLAHGGLYARLHALQFRS